MAEQLTRVPRVREVCSSKTGPAKSFANSSPPLQHLRKCCLGAMTQSWAQQTRYTLLRNTASIMKSLVWSYN